MKTFTVRDLDRKPGAVLDACEREGAVQIRRRDGKTFTIKPNSPPVPKVSFSEWLDEIDRRRHRLFPRAVMTRKQVRQFDKWLANEDRVL